jgi:putative transposase
MKAYSLDLRQRGVAFVLNGGKKTEAARRFGVGCDTIYRFLNARAAKTLAPKTSWGHWRKLDPQRLRAHVKAHPDATLAEMKDRFNVSLAGLWTALKKTGHTLKKSHRLPRAG